MTQIILTFIPFFIFTIVFKLKINNMSNFIFLGFISMILTVIVDLLIGMILPFTLDSTLLAKQGFIISFINYLIIGGIPEETCKYIALKLSKPKTETQILINSLYL